MDTDSLRLTSRHEEELYDVLKNVRGYKLTSLETSFRCLKMEHAIQIHALLPSLLEFCQVASVGIWGENNSRLGLIVRLLVFATGVTCENFTLSSYLALLSAFRKISNNLRSVLKLNTAQADLSRDYVMFCIDRIAGLRRNLISQSESTMPWPDIDSVEKFSSLPRDCFHYVIKNYLYNPCDLLSLALTNQTFFTLVFDCSLWDDLIHTHSPLDTDYRSVLPLGSVVDDYKVVCYVIKFYCERYKRKYVKRYEVLFRRCVVCDVVFWSFQNLRSYNHLLFCPASYFLDCTAQEFVAYLQFQWKGLRI